MRRVVTGAVALGVAASAAFATGEFRGRIVDASGAPVAGAVLAPRWAFPEAGSHQKPAPAAGEPTAMTDERGVFALAGRQETWLALDAARAHGVLVIRTEPGVGDPPAFKLAPLEAFHGAYAIEAAGHIPGTLGTWVAPRGGSAPVASCIAPSDRFAFALPPGSYELFYSNGDLDHRARMTLSTTVELLPGSAPLDLGRVPLRLPRVIQVAGRVLGPDGAPIAGAAVARVWSIDGVSMAGTPAYTTDRAGRFTGVEPVPGGAFSLLALDAERARGAIATVDPEHTALLTLQLEPTVEVAGRVEVRATGKPPEWTSVGVALHGQPTRIIQGTRTDGTFRFRLPPGDYDLYCQGAGVHGRFERLVLEPGAAPLDLGTLALEPTVRAQATGRPAPPLTVTEARGVPPDFTLEKLRGKWVAIEFWGHWCSPCIQQSLPDLARLQREYADRQDHFQILAVHDTTVRTLDELDDLLTPLAEEFWGGEPLPFPILLDATGETLERYGISNYPTLVLIDPDGLILPGDHEALEALLEGL